MRNIGARLGIRAASLYEHFADKRAVENAIIAATLYEMGDATRSRMASNPGEEPVFAIMTAYREFALAHPELYRLLMSRDLDRNAPDLASADEYSAGSLGPFYPGREQELIALWAFAHGVLDLELTGRLGSLPYGTSLAKVWDTGLAIFMDRLGKASAPAAA